MVQHCQVEPLCWPRQVCFSRTHQVLFRRSLKVEKCGRVNISEHTNAKMLASHANFLHTKSSRYSCATGGLLGSLQGQIFAAYECDYVVGDARCCRSFAWGGVSLRGFVPELQLRVRSPMLSASFHASCAGVCSCFFCQSHFRAQSSRRSCTSRTGPGCRCWCPHFSQPGS